MGNYFKTRRLTLLALLAGLSYAFLIVNTVIIEWDSFVPAFVEGWNSANYTDHAPSSKSSRSYYLMLNPKLGTSSYPDSLLNLVDHTTIQSKYKETVALASPGSRSRYSLWYDFFLFVCGLAVSVTYFVIPFHFYKLMGWIQKEIIFEKEIIRLIRWLGIELLIVYFGNVLFNYISYKIDSSIFSFSEYDINMHSMDAIWLLFGVVVLLIAEILSKALTIKEEQELTI